MTLPGSVEIHLRHLTPKPHDRSYPLYAVSMASAALMVGRGMCVSLLDLNVFLCQMKDLSRVARSER